LIYRQRSRASTKHGPSSIFISNERKEKKIERISASREKKQASAQKRGGLVSYKSRKDQLKLASLAFGVKVAVLVSA
jgi:hypothetical protein